jgi:hypothetical protein
MPSAQPILNSGSKDHYKLNPQHSGRQLLLMMTRDNIQL